MGKSGRKFDLGGLMEVVSNLDTTAVDSGAAVPEVKLIPLADIVDNNVKCLLNVAFLHILIDFLSNKKRPLSLDGAAAFLIDIFLFQIFVLLMITSPCY